MALERLQGVTQAKGHSKIFEETTWCDYGCFWNGFFVYWDLVVGLGQIQ